MGFIALGLTGLRQRPVTAPVTRGFREQGMEPPARRHLTWRPRGLSKSVISRVIIGVTPFRVLITLLMSHLLSPLGLQVEASFEAPHLICPVHTNYRPW